MATFTKQTIANADDVQESYGGGNWAYSDSLSYLGKSDSYWTREGGFRFTSVTIPQGSTITSAKLSFKAGNTFNRTIALKIKGIDVDNCGAFSSGDRPRNRTHTTAQIDWDGTINVSLDDWIDSASITSVVQEIVNRGGWSSGNAIGFYIADDGSANSNYIESQEYEDGSANAPKLTIVYSGSSPSSSPSLSPSASASPSASQSPSASISPSASPSASISPSPSPAVPFYGLKIAKPGYNVLTETEPNNLVYSSDYGTLKYFTKTSVNVQIDANNDDIANKGTCSHNLGYYPFVEVYVRVYIGSPSGDYEYVPFAGSGATVLYSANYTISTTEISLYAVIDGVSSSVWNFDFLIFIYKNDLKLT